MALAPLSIFIHSRSKGMILDASGDGLPCFPSSRVWEIASLREFSSWLVIAGNALF